MKARQRVKIAMKGGIPDRVPVFPVITDMHYSHMYGAPLWLTHVLPRLKADLIEMAEREYGFDGFEFNLFGPHAPDKYEVAVLDNGDKILKRGGRPWLKLYEDNYPSEIEPREQPVFKDLAQVKKLTYMRAENFKSGGFLSEFERLRKRFADDAYIACCTAGFTMNGLVNLRGSDRAFVDLYDEPELVHAIFEHLTASAIEAAKAAVSAGADGLYIGDAFASCSVISPQIFKEFCLPYYQMFVKEIKPLGADIYLHICGNASPILELMADTGADAIEPLDPLGGVSVADAKKRVGSRVCLKGGVNTLSLLNSTPEEVAEETKKVLSEGMANGGFILGSGDDIPRFAKKENIKAMVETCHKLGKYSSRDTAALDKSARSCT